MKIIDGFDKAIERAEHLLKIYDLIHNTRKRAIGSGWANKFNKLIHWPVSEKFIRIDGKKRESILIIKESVGISSEQFSHDYLSELLRAALVAAVSALDKYMHDLVVGKSVSLLRQSEEKIPSEFKKIRIPILEAQKALKHLKNDSESRPGHIIKKAIQTVLHRDYTFQGSASILKATRMIGIENFWENILTEMSPLYENKKEIISKLDKIAKRRNQIVHEADVPPMLKPRKINLREISRKEIEEDIKFIKEFVSAIEKVAHS